MNSTETSRIEELLKAILGMEAKLEPPQSRVETLLWAILESGGGGATDYNLLSNLPKINGETLEGDKTAATLGLASGDDVTTLANKITNIDNGGLSHNGIFRGKNLTNVYTVDEMYEMIHSGNFDDLYLGDYFTKSITTDIYTHFTGAEFDSGTTYYEMDGTINDRTWTETSDTVPQSGKTYATKLTKTENVILMFAAFDYYYNMGDTALTTHHAVLIPKTFFATTAKMNPTNTTAGGYYNSDMHQITLPCYAKSLKTALGNHLLAHKTGLTTAVNTSTPSMAGAGMTGASSASAWETTELQLMNEVQLYGTMVWSSSAYEVGVDNKKLPVFNFINPIQYGRNLVWLRSVVSSTFLRIATTTAVLATAARPSRFSCAR